MSNVDEEKYIEEAREAAHAAGLPFYEGSEEEFDAFCTVGGVVYDGNMSIEDYELWLERQEGGEAVAQEEHKSKLRHSRGEKMKTIVVFNQKGGVGKTSTVANLMAELKLKGYAVLGIDLDAQANLTAFNGIVNPKRTVRDLLLNTCSVYDVKITCKYGDVIPSDTSLQNELLRFASMPAFVIRLRDIIKPLSCAYDVILIDCPPVVNQVTAAAIVAADYIIVPAEAEYFSAVGIKMIAETVEQVKPLNPGIKVLGVLLVKYQNRRNLTKSIESVLSENVRKLLDCNVFDAKIRFTVDIPSSQASGLSVKDFKRESKATSDYESLCSAIIKEMDI